MTTKLKEYFKFERKQLALISIIAIIGCIFYNLETIKPSLFSDKSVTLTIEDVRDFCTILGIILIPMGWIYNEYQQRILDQHNSKEKKYQLILRSAGALLYEDLRNPKIQELAYKFIKEFQICYLYVPDNIVKAGREFLETLEKLFEDPEENLSSELKETLDTENQIVVPETHEELYRILREVNYPKLIKAIRRDMLSMTSLSDEEFVINIPCKIKVEKHLQYVGQTVSHLILLLSEAYQDNDAGKLNILMQRFISYLDPHYDKVSYNIDKDNKIIVTISSIKYNMVELLDKLSIRKSLGTKETINIKKIFEKM